jgi:NTP pyrophosphatase (non-canonical NTP hydrolase)
MKESQGSINAWILDTFGPTGSTLSCAVRANEEMAELLKELAKDDTSPEAAKEIGDIVIILYRIAERLGVSLEDEVDKAMAINRKRKWLVSNGHGYHIKD